MSKVIIIFIILGSILLAEAAPYDYDYYMMVEQWPPATCSSSSHTLDCYQRPPEMFTIHGLWPSRYPGRGQPTCSGSEFDVTKVASITDPLITYWPDVIYGGHKEFWRREWNKHGTCAESAKQLNELSYFEVTLGLAVNHDILAILAKVGIAPDGQMRSSEDVANAIKAATKSRPGLRCNTNRYTRRVQLWEVVLCLGKNGYFMDCPISITTCPYMFVWG